MGSPPSLLPLVPRPRFGAVRPTGSTDDRDVRDAGGTDDADAAQAARDDIAAMFRSCEGGQVKDTEMESTVSTVFCNQLYAQMASVLRYGRSEEDGDGGGEEVPDDDPLWVVYGHNRNRLPLPPQRIDITIPIDDPRRIAEKEKARD